MVVAPLTICSGVSSTILPLQSTAFQSCLPETDKTLTMLNSHPSTKIGWKQNSVNRTKAIESSSVNRTEAVRKVYFLCKNKFVSVGRKRTNVSQAQSLIKGYNAFHCVLDMHALEMNLYSTAIKGMTDSSQYLETDTVMLNVENVQIIISNVFIGNAVCNTGMDTMSCGPDSFTDA